MVRFATRLSAPYPSVKTLVWSLLIFVSGMLFGLIATTSLHKLDLFDLFGFGANVEGRIADENLFRSASMVLKKHEYPYTVVPKVAFLFLTRGPLPLIPLWERFFHGHEDFFSVYVHTVPGYKLNVSKSSPFYDREIPSQDTEWGSITLTDAEKRLLANALLDFSNERFVLLSESCIPLHDFSTIYKYLTESAHSFVDSYDNPGITARGRYSRRLIPYIMLSDWRKGAQWFEMNRILASQIISETKYYPQFKKYCRQHCYPDEHYMPTYVSMFFPTLNANRTLTWVDWSRGGGHPSTYGGADITERFLQSIRNRWKCQYNYGETSTCYLFARKFSHSALEPLLSLASTVMKY
ncbi:hypothetical protein C5167_045696 [Papaver somniferum]|uniref:Uncharacterized protein n=1 Tax=Papaver somniferum TaxID=3469 RepID=A0A4Y7LE58_PAPSO|nr:uncharacterized protein LOC113323492 [Papaver somniferum]RZC82910.1 hypothetical protein C5167_045696 [Papaver somniferum]